MEKRGIEQPDASHSGKHAFKDPAQHVEVLHAEDIINEFLTSLASDLKKNDRILREFKDSLSSEFNKELL